jgi:hypothetical protein
MFSGDAEHNGGVAIARRYLEGGRVKGLSGEVCRCL